MELTHEDKKRIREHDWSSKKNVRDQFKGMTDEQIKQALKPYRNSLQIAFVNALRDFNFGGIIRGSNAFCCESILYAGHRRYDPRGTVGTKNYEHIVHFAEEDELKNYIRMDKMAGVRFVVAEWIEGDPRMIDLPSYQWNDQSILMLGEEGSGVPEEYLDMADDIVYVPQYGSVRSMNVASTFHVFAYDYMVKTGRM